MMFPCRRGLDDAAQTQAGSVEKYVEFGARSGAAAPDHDDFEVDEGGQIGGVGRHDRFGEKDPPTLGHCLTAVAQYGGRGSSAQLNTTRPALTVQARCSPMPPNGLRH